MACLSHFALDAPNCGAKMGGIRALLWSRDAGMTDVNLTPGSDYSGEIDGNFYRIPGRGSFQSVAQVNEDESGIYYRDEFNFNPDGYEAGADPLAYLMAAFSEMGDDDVTVLAEDWNGKYHVLGFGLASLALGTTARYPVWMSTGQEGTGTEHTDRTGWALTLASQHPLPALVSSQSFTVINPSND